MQSPVNIVYPIDGGTYSIVDITHKLPPAPILSGRNPTVDPPR